MHLKTRVYGTIIVSKVCGQLLCWWLLRFNYLWFLPVLCTKLFLFVIADSAEHVNQHPMINMGLRNHRHRHYCFFTTPLLGI